MRTSQSAEHFAFDFVNRTEQNKNNVQRWGASPIKPIYLCASVPSKRKRHSQSGMSLEQRSIDFSHCLNLLLLFSFFIYCYWEEEEEEEAEKEEFYLVSIWL